MSVTPRLRSCARIGMYQRSVSGRGAGAPPRPRTASRAAGESRTVSTAPACSASSASRPSETSIRAISSTRQARSPRVSWRWMMGLIMLPSSRLERQAWCRSAIWLLCNTLGSETCEAAHASKHGLVGQVDSTRGLGVLRLPVYVPAPMKATDIRKGHVLMIDGQPCRVMDFTHRTPGNLRAFVQVRFRNLVSGNTFDQRLAATDFLQEARLDTKEMQVLYQDQGGVHVMDQQTYEQFTLDERAVGEDTPWLQPEMVVQVEWLDGRPIAIELPGVIELKVVETSPVMKTATKTASTKPAKLSNGVTVQVPEFISPGATVRVDPRSGEYLERAK